MANAVQDIRAVFKAAEKKLTLADIKALKPELQSNQISMALCYFMRQRYVTREQIDAQNAQGRKKIWLYSYHNEKLPQPETV